MDFQHFLPEYSRDVAVLLGNGPSLRQINLGLLCRLNVPVFGLNRVAMLYSTGEFSCDVYVCVSSNIADAQWRKDVFEGIKRSKISFIWETLMPYCAEIIDEYQDRIVWIKCVHGDQTTLQPPLEWWDVSGLKFTKYGTSMSSVYQLAKAMGFKRLIFLGVDLNFEESFWQKLFYRLHMPRLGHLFDKNHFASSYGTPGASAAYLNSHMGVAFEMIQKDAQQHGIQLRNGSKNKFDTFERVNLDEEFGLGFYKD